MKASVPCRCHQAVVELYERIPMEIKENPQSWAYTHTIMSYIKDATGIFRCHNPTC